MDRYEFELRKLVDSQIERLKDVLAVGSPSSLDEYKLIVGQIIGLRQCLDLFEEARHNANKSR